MKLRFHKYHGTGNDFILIDNRELRLDPDEQLVAHLCNRRFGIGSDGLMLLDEKPGCDFAMRFFNPDGKESTLCGNGSRCMTAFAHHLGLAGDEARFFAADGEHISKITREEGKMMIVTLKMQDVQVRPKTGDHFLIDTGSPHYVLFEKNIAEIDILKKAREIRYSKAFAEKGTNVDFVEFTKEGLFVRSYERGVEDETLSCGTGVTASALAAAVEKPDNPGFFEVDTPGGKLRVSFIRNNNRFSEIWLEGPAVHVFSGETEI